jgi:hypothetical protein
MSNYIYAIFGGPDFDSIDNAVEKAFSESDRFQITSGQWLVRSQSALAAEVSAQLIGDGEHFYNIIVRFKDYYGWNDKAVWEWAEVKARGE